MLATEVWTCEHGAHPNALFHLLKLHKCIYIYILSSYFSLIFELLGIIQVIQDTVAEADTCYAELINEHWNNPKRETKYVKAVGRPEAISVNYEVGRS